MTKRKLALEFVLEDFWVGCFWRKSADRFDLWVCLVPCFPVHYSRFEGEIFGEPLLPIEKRHLTARSNPHPKDGWTANGNEFTRTYHHQ